MCPLHAQDFVGSLSSLCCASIFHLSRARASPTSQSFQGCEIFITIHGLRSPQHATRLRRSSAQVPPCTFHANQIDDQRHQQQGIVVIASVPLPGPIEQMALQARPPSSTTTLTNDHLVGRVRIVVRASVHHQTKPSRRQRLLRAPEPFKEELHRRLRMSVMLQEATEVLTTMHIPRDKVRLRFEANSVGKTSGPTVHGVCNDSVKNQKLQQAICQAVVFPPEPAHPALETHRTQLFERTLVRPLGTSNHTGQSKQKLFDPKAHVVHEQTLRPTGSCALHLLQTTPTGPTSTTTRRPPAPRQDPGQKVAAFQPTLHR